MFSAFDVGLQGFVSAVALPGNYTRNKERGQAPAVAALDAAWDAATVTALNPATYMVAIASRGLAGAAYRGFRNANINIRQARTPFSHSFQHSATTSRLQAFGLERMGAMSGMGNEANAMYGRYGR